MTSPITPLTPKPLLKQYTSFESMLDEVRVYVPNVSDKLALHVLRNSAIDFCRQTGLWYEEMMPIVGIPMEPFYTVATPQGTVVAFFNEVWYNGVRIENQSTEQLKKRYVNDWTDITIYNGPPCWYTHHDLCTIRLVPCPNVNDNEAQITGFMTLQPTRDSLGLLSDIAERWIEGIGYGARSRLYDTPDTPFYNPGMAQKYARMAMNEIGKGKIQANQSRGRGPLNVNKRPWPFGG